MGKNGRGNKKEMESRKRRKEKRKWKERKRRIEGRRRRRNKRGKEGKREGREEKEARGELPASFLALMARAAAQVSSTGLPGLQLMSPWSCRSQILRFFKGGIQAEDMAQG